MGFKVICSFADSKDNNHIYNVGDIYPRDGFMADDERINALSTNENRHGTVFIEKVKDNDDSRTSKPNSRRFGNRAEK